MDVPGRGWSDPWATWRHAVEVKIDAGQGADELANDLEPGARLLGAVAAGRAERAHRDADRRGEGAARHRAAAARAGRPGAVPASSMIMAEHPVRELITHGQPHQV